MNLRGGFALVERLVALVDAVPQFLLSAGLWLDDPAFDLPAGLVDARPATAHWRV